VLGARVGADTTTGRVTSWSAGLNYTRMTADGGPGGVERLNGQQVGSVLWFGGRDGCFGAGMRVQGFRWGQLWFVGGSTSWPTVCCTVSTVVSSANCSAVPNTVLCDICLAACRAICVARACVCCLLCLQWGVVVNDTTGSKGGRSATLSLHQQLSGGKTSLAAEYTLPITGE
jgi:hypothetical protein